MKSPPAKKSPRRTEGNRGQRLNAVCFIAAVFASGFAGIHAGINIAVLLLEVLK